MKLFIKYLPIVSTTQSNVLDVLQSWLPNNYPNVTYTEVLSDSTAHFGILEGNSDDLSKCLSSIQSKFSITQMTESVFAGVIKRNYNPVTPTDGFSPPPLSFNDFISQFSITPPANTLDAIKEAKIALLLEQVRRKFPHQNDLITDLSRVVLLQTQYYSTLTPEQKTQVDSQINILKTIFPVDQCISSLVTMTTLLSTVFSQYTTYLTQILAATTEEEVNAITYTL